ncbi:hypothetical protein HMPREF9186_00553 [Streptococcus sp. F0442]|uniref:DUF3272 family protein n=1 Tax=Streptococcus sp. F0442 TaxID=999425 RepID=UPI00029951E2|nr:DUF3272 family protein [Streptococcus sp. F0442]EKS20699.1 hypothetical protein HMPREF9186_00553 [Streptococcus sp. F0442]
MNTKQFVMLAVFTAMETYFFNEATMAGQMLFAFFWAVLILRNLQTAYMVEKIANAIEKEMKKKRK